MTNATDGFWTKERTDILKAKWESGRHTAKEIGFELGCSRNAVIGKAQREGFHQGTPPPGERGGVVAKKVGNKKKVLLPRNPVWVNSRAHTQAATIAPTIDDNRVGIDIMQLTTKTCRAVLGQKGTNGLATYCGLPVLEHSFCAGHHAIYFIPGSARR